MKPLLQAWNRVISPYIEKNRVSQMVGERNVRSNLSSQMSPISYKLVREQVHGKKWLSSTEVHFLTRQHSLMLMPVWSVTCHSGNNQRDSVWVWVGLPLYLVLLTSQQIVLWIFTGVLPLLLLVVKHLEWVTMGPEQLSDSSKVKGELVRESSIELRR